MTKHDRRRRKKDERRKKKQAYDARRAARREEALAEGATRNAGVPRGRQVVVGDVSAYALEGHPPCRGTGMTGTNASGDAVPCTCATRRFFKAHPEVIVVPDAGSVKAWWPANIKIEEVTDDGQEQERSDAEGTGYEAEGGDGG